MKVALVHDYLKEYGGAERVLEALHELWPNAPVYTTVYLPEYLGPHKERFKGWDIRTSWAQKLPFKAKLISPLRLLAPHLFKSLDFSKYDVIIVSATGAYNPNMIEKKSALQICYCHTPPRYLYGFATAREWKKNPIIRIVGEFANHFLLKIDFSSSKNVDYFIANSKNVADRIKRFYKKDSVVIYPPVDVEAFSELASSVQLENKKLNPNKLDAKRYYVAGGRLARPKHITLIVETCIKQGLPLKVFGKGFAGYEVELKTTNQNSKVEFVGEVSDEEKLELMRSAKAYIFASEDEDFGITPVEAMSVGTPVIAYRSGGVVESVIEGKTGIFFDELTVKSLSLAIEQLNNTAIDSKDCIIRAQKFSKERFKTEIQLFVSSKLRD